MSIQILSRFQEAQFNENLSLFSQTQSQYIEVVQGDIFKERKMRFGLVLGQLAILKKNGGRL